MPPSGPATPKGPRARPFVVLVAVGTLLAGCGTTLTAKHVRSSPTTLHRQTPSTSTSSSEPSPTSAPPPPPSAPTPPTTAAASGPGSPCGTTSSPPARYQHVVWIWMENHSWSTVIGNAAAPYLSALAHECGTDTNYAAVGSPSLPNYLGATSGSTQGVSDDADPAAHTFAVDNLFRQVRTAGGTERSFVESMPTRSEE